MRMAYLLEFVSHGENVLRHAKLFRNLIASEAALEFGLHPVVDGKIFC